MNKKYLITIVILISFFYIIQVKDINAVTPSTEFCSGVVVCPNPNVDPDKYNFTINCKKELDGYCPENYSKSAWLDQCPDVNTGKCYPCDPDCGFCAHLTLLITRRINLGDPTIGVLGFENYKKQVNIKLVRDNCQDHRTNCERGVNVHCPGDGDPGNTGVCTAQFNDTILGEDPNYEADEAGERYCYAAESKGTIQETVGACGNVRPQVSLSLNGVQIPNGETRTVIDNPNIELLENAHSKAGLRYGDIYVYTKDKKSGELKYVNVKDENSPDYCSMRCPVGGCEPLASKNIPSPYPTIIPPPEIKGILNGKKCENKEFIIAATAKDVWYELPGDEGKGNFTLKINNNNPVCTDECSIFTSKTLKTIVAKLKSWIISS